MSAVETLFRFNHDPVRALSIDGSPWWVAADILSALDLSRSSLTSLDYDEKGVHTVDTLGGAQELTIINEPGLYSLILRSRKPYAKRFKRWITHEVIPTIRQTGAYSAAPAPVELDRRALALMVIEAEDARVAAEQRAVEGERFRDAIESSDGLSPREFHKAYFADIREKDFFAILYSRRLLINQLGKGTRRENGTYRDGAQHGHPGYEGKRFFYLDSGVNPKTGYRFEQTRVRPGQPELDLIDYLAKRGMEPTRAASKELSLV